MTITHQDVQRLFDTQLDEPVLILTEGRTLVVSAADVDDRYPGALTIGSKTGLVDEFGADGPSERERGEVAARWDTEVSQRGG
ncbi:hypothetical protein [Actinocrispum sp. NPDC049592]|uniref:hypothetical protein n=1 Tax=Actinocrispum sp. NPDC049592 TaxID=3154835 RepID=UPI0034173455